MSVDRDSTEAVVAEVLQTELDDKINDFREDSQLKNRIYDLQASQFAMKLQSDTTVLAKFADLRLNAIDEDDLASKVSNALEDEIANSWDLTQSANRARDYTLELVDNEASEIDNANQLRQKIMATTDDEILSWYIKSDNPLQSVFHVDDKTARDAQRVAEIVLDAERFLVVNKFKKGLIAIQTYRQSHDRESSLFERQAFIVRNKIGDDNEFDKNAIDDLKNALRNVDASLNEIYSMFTDGMINRLVRYVETIWTASDELTYAQKVIVSFIPSSFTPEEQEKSVENIENSDIETLMSLYNLRFKDAEFKQKLLRMTNVGDLVLRVEVEEKTKSFVARCLNTFMTEHEIGNKSDFVQNDSVQKTVDDIANSILPDLKEDSITTKNGVDEYFRENVDFEFVNLRLVLHWNFEKSREQAVDLIGENLMANPEYANAHSLDWYVNKMRSLRTEDILHGMSHIDEFYGNYLSVDVNNYE